MNIVDKFEQDQIELLKEVKEIPEFRAGDTVRVTVKIAEGNRTQAFEGVCISRRNKGVDSSFVVRKISHDQAVERIFPLYSPRVAAIEVVKRGVVRRAKLYYMRGLRGKVARIKERITARKNK